MSVSSFDLSEMQIQNSIDARRALDVLSPEYTQPKYPLLANTLVPGGNAMSPSELAGSIVRTFPGVSIENVGLDELTYSYDCAVRTVGTGIDPSGEAYAPVSERMTRRSISVGTSGVAHIDSRDIDSAPGRTVRPGSVVLEPYQDPVTGESLFTDSSGAHYTLPGKMHTCIQDTAANWVIGHTLERTYTKNPDGTYTADLELQESFLGGSESASSRRDELFAATNPLFPGEASTQDALKAVAYIRQMARANAIKQRGNIDDIYIDDLPNGSVAVGFQFAQNGRIWMYQYIVDAQGYTTHYSYGRNRLFASPEEQEHDEAVEWWVETTFEYGIDTFNGQKRMLRLGRATKEEVAYGVVADSTKIETYTYTHLAHASGDYVIANVKRDEMKGGDTTHKSFDFQRDVIEPLELDTSEGNPIAMVQTQAVREERAIDSIPKYEGEHLRRVYHYGFVPNEDLSIPLVVVRASDGSSLHCQIDKNEPVMLVPARK